MNTRAVAHILGTLILLLGMTMVLPLLTAVWCQEADGYAFAISALVAVVVGVALRFWGSDDEFSHREACAIVTFSWILVAALAGLPFWLSGVVPTYVDGLFEAMSGVTTTGATVLTHVEGVPKATILWRGLLHWIGGMGFIVLSVAVLPNLGGGRRQLFETEIPGPVPERLKPRIRQTATVLWGIYLVMTLLQILLLLVSKMSLFEAVVHAFGTMATGGFSSRNRSVESFQSPYVEVIILVFMILAGTNFTLHYRFVRTRSLRGFWRSEEFVAYLGIMVGATILITIDLWKELAVSLIQAVRLGSFQVVSVMTTTGFSSANFDTWPPLSRILLLLLMFVGGSAGSTGGALKVMRLVLVYKYIQRELLRLIHPRAVRYITLDGEVVEERIVQSIVGFVLFYVALFAVGTVVMAGFGLEPMVAASSVAATLGNVGPGFGPVGPYGNYAALPSMAKAWLSFLMLAGRLEIFSVMVLFLPLTWRRRSLAK